MRPYLPIVNNQGEMTMKFAGNKRIYLFTVTILLLLLLVLPLKNHFTNVEASSNYQIRMLEVTESGISELASLTSGLANFTVDTMSMKRFVALRDDLDGRYDAVYIGKGTYSPAQVSNQKTASEENRARALDTKSMKNDITLLKADQITKEFIDKGLYVFFNSQPFKDKDNKRQDERGILYSSFNSYRLSSSNPKVKFVDDTGLATIFADLKKQDSTYINDLKKRPRLQITNRIPNYDPDATNSKTYVTGEKLTFNFNVTKASTQQSAPLSVKLYIGLDKSIKMGEKQLVAETEINTSNGTIEYTLPKTYSGLLYWKLEVNDYHSTQLKDFDSGVIRYRGERTIVNILQVMPDTLTESSLLNASNMNPLYLNRNDYQLNIAVQTMTQFNTYVDKKYAATQSYGLNGTYDMLIFGFVDEYYKKSNLNTNAINAITQFTGTFKQSALFTHDTIINLDASKKNWINNFMGITGQMNPETNLGHNAINLSTKVKPVNDGLLMQYPFYLSKRDDNNKQVDIIQPQIAPTHNQYFTLNLEDPEVVSWYNIQSEASGTKIKPNGEYNQYQRDTEDSWNQYYTYSKGNITYSGTGHFFGVSDIPANLKKFPDWEQQLFVNTMYRAFIGANHAPEITVHTPTNDSSIPSYQKTLLVDYTVTDLDFNDRDLTTEVRFKINGKYLDKPLVSKTSIKSGQNIYKTFNNPLPEGGTLDIEINAWDQSGALSSKTISVNVLQMNSNLSVTRSLSENATITGKVERGENVTLSYSITPKPVPFENVSTANQAYNTQLISDIVFTENFPPNLEISGELPAGTIVTGNVTSGYRMTRNLSNITYSLKTENGKQIYKPDSEQPITFQITVTPTQTQTYTLNDSKLTYVDIHATLPPLAITNKYNAFILQTTSLRGGTIKGPIASGGTINFNNAGIDVNQQYKGTVPYGIVTGGDIHLPAGTIYGNVLVKGVVRDQRPGSIQNGEISYGELLNFSKQGDYFRGLSDAIAKLPTNGLAIPDRSGSITLSGNSSINIFDIKVNDLSKLTSSILNVPPGSTVIVNVKEDGTDQPFLHFPLGSDGSRVLFNFPTTKTDPKDPHKLRIFQANAYGTILAPWSDITFDGGQVYGTIIGASMSMSSATLFHFPFTGKLPAEIYPLPVPAPTDPSSANLARTTISFETLTFTAEYKIRALQLEDKTIYVGDKIRLIPIVTPSDLSNSAFLWTTDNGSIVQVDPSSGDIVGLAEGKAVITVTALSDNKVSNTATITVKNIRRDHSLTIEGEKSGKVKELIHLNAHYVQNNNNQGSENPKITYTWSVTNLATGAIVDALTPDPMNSSDNSQKEFSVSQSGKYLVSLTVSSSNREDISASMEIVITNPLKSLSIDGSTTVLVGEQIDLSAIRNPTDADPSTLSWRFVKSTDENITDDAITNDHIATLTPSGDGSTAKLTAGDTAKAGLLIEVSFNGITSTHKVNIVDALTGLRFNNQSITLEVGNTYPLTNILWAFPTSISIDQIKENLSWISNSPDIASVYNGSDVNTRGIVTGVKKGSTIITVTYTGSTGTTVKADITVKVVAPQNDDRY
jgi:choice-of-anchor A domain-containing protein